MFDLIAPILVPSPLANLQTILDALLGVPSEFMLASVWSFNRFDPDAASIAEFDVPGGWDLLGARVAAYAGLELVAAESDPTELAYLRLELGQPVVLAVDSHELPYRPAYGRVHSARTILATRIDRSAGTVDVLDPWPPTYTGSIPISMLDRARQSDVPEDRVREPLYAGVELKRRWWTLALAADARSRTVDGAMTAIAELAHEAETTASADAIERFRVIVAEAMSKGTARGRFVGRLRCTFGQRSGSGPTCWRCCAGLRSCSAIRCSPPRSIAGRRISTRSDLPATY